MEKLPGEKTIYEELQKKLFYIIPEKWDKIFLYASYIDIPKKRPVGEMYFYYFPKGIIKKKPINCYEIPSAFNIDEDEYSKLITDLYNTIKELRQIWAKKTNKLWSNITISILNNQFKVEYDYQDLKRSNFDSFERHVIWRYLYIDSDKSSLSKKDKNVIDKYFAYINEVQLPKKDIYTEGLYELPVKNIVDFEKTLSVEEAIAQTQKDEEMSEKPKEKKKHVFLKRKRAIDDVIELDDGNEVFNNQILSWRKDD